MPFRMDVPRNVKAACAIRQFLAEAQLEGFDSQNGPASQPSLFCLTADPGETRWLKRVNCSTAATRPPPCRRFRNFESLMSAVEAA